jgi:uncharacterized protein YjbI with pentapeptide repeats
MKRSINSSQGNQNLIVTKGFWGNAELKKLIEELNYFASPSLSKVEGIHLQYINKLINNNLRLILSQTGNNDTAPQLKKAMLDLSQRIFKEECGSDANNLAFEVQCYAMGLFEEVSYLESEFPEDPLKCIFLNLLQQSYTPYQNINSGLKETTWVSKNWQKSSNEVKKERVCREGISLRKVTNCQTATEAVEFIIKNKLTAANLSDYPDLTDDDLTKLIKSCPNLNSLYISSSKITEEKLAEGLKKLTQLRHLDLSNCRQITGDKLAEALKTLTQLQHLNLSWCHEITGDKLAEALKTLTQLRHLDLSQCVQITEDKLVEALKTLTQLQHLDLHFCQQITGYWLTETLKTLTQLRQLDLSYCEQITEDKLAEALKALTQLRNLKLRGCRHITGDWFAETLKTLTQLRHLDLSFCNITGEKLAEALKTLTQLQHLNLRGCYHITGDKLVTEDKLAEALKTFPQLKVLI